jgi:hypothetical protein
VVGHVEEHGQRAGQNADEVELLDPQRARDGRKWNGAKEEGPTDVGHDQDRPSGQSVDPDAREQAEQQERGELECGEQAHLGRRGVQDQGRRQRDGQLADLAAETRDRVPRPQLDEFRVSPQAAERNAAHRARSVEHLHGVGVSPGMERVRRV